LGLGAAVTGTLTHDHFPLLVTSRPSPTLRHRFRSASGQWPARGSHR
jgi:hypothetical protein